MSAFNSLVEITRLRWLRRTVLALCALVLLFGLFGYLALPGIIKSQAEQAVAAALHRKLTIERVEVRPFALAVSVQGAKLYEADGQRVFVSFQDLSARLSASSLFRLAPVVRQVHLSGPEVHLARTGPNRYSTDDIVAVLAARPAQPAAATPAEARHGARFSVYNIQVDGGRIEFDDQPAHTLHTVSDLKIGIPFISSLPSQEEVFVEPLLSAVVNGAPLLVKGRARPFADTREAIVDLDLDGVDIPKYLQYLPFEPRFRMVGAKLDVHLKASFQQPLERPPAVIVSGKVALKSLQVAALDGTPIVALPQFTVELASADPLAGRIEVAAVTATGLDLNVIRDARGRLNLELLGPAAPEGPAAPAQAGAPAPSAAPASGGSPWHVAIGKIALQDAAVRFTDRSPARPLEAGVEQFDLRVSDSALDLAARRLMIGRIESAGARFRMQHGRTEAERAAAPGPAAAAPAGRAAPAASPPPGVPAPWAMSIGHVAIGNWAARVESRGLPHPAVTAVSALEIGAEDLSNAEGAAPGRIDVKAKVNRTGSLSVAGALGVAPLHTDLTLDLKGVDLLALQPYFTEQVNLLVTQADLSVRGKLALDQAGDGSFKGRFRGDAAVGNLATIDKVNSNDFVNWKSLSFAGVDARLAPLAVDIDRIALNDFFARVIIDPSGRINLQDIARSGAQTRSLTSEQPQAAQAAAPEAAAGAAPEPAAAAPEPAAAAAPEPAATAAAAPAKVVPIRIRQVALQRGRVRFTDNFIKPNYTANLEDLGGTVTGLSSQIDTAADVDLKGQVNNAPLNIAGRINPIKGDLFMDLKAGVHGMELAPLSPYSNKYVGYGIERGKLSFDVAYQLDHRQLKARNRLVLDQLTFGERVESPTATKLPVLLAVALLKDRNGVIDLDVPIGGSLDDPQFSVGGVIVKVIVNLLTKAVTAPFALLGKLFGGGEELSFIEYAPGSDQVSEAAQARLKSLAAALNDRPGLRLEIAAWVDPASDRDGLRRQSLDHRVRALKVKDLVAKGQAATVAEVTVSPEEYPALLARLYQADKAAKAAAGSAAQAADKPAKGGGSGAQPPPTPEQIEKLLLEDTVIRDEDLTALGDRRSQAVKQWLQTTGQVPEPRLFLLATKVAATGAPDQPAQAAGKSSRVEFSLK